MLRSRQALGALALVAAALAAPLPAGAASHRQAATAVTVTAKEFRFVLSRASVPRGRVVFTLVNRGKLSHDFKIAGKKTPLVAHGKRARLVVTFRKSGRYPYLCTVPGHAKLGMKGVLRVR